MSEIGLVVGGVFVGVALTFAACGEA
ncbi:MAG: hypothetical protein RIT28_1670, partial [Pseudomonadota bacterium]